MRKIQTKQIKVNQLPVSTELIMYSNLSNTRNLANVTEVWDKDVADFYMGLFPDSMQLGANISDLQQRANIEAFTGIHNVSSFLNFLDGMIKDNAKDDEDDK